MNQYISVSRFVGIAVERERERRIASCVECKQKDIREDHEEERQKICHLSLKRLKNRYVSHCCHKRMNASLDND